MTGARASWRAPGRASRARSRRRRDTAEQRRPEARPPGARRAPRLRGDGTGLSPCPLLTLIVTASQRQGVPPLAGGRGELSRGGRGARRWVMRQDGAPLTRGREHLQKRAQCVRAPAADAPGRSCARVLTWERARRSAAADPGGPRQGHDRRSVEGVAAAVGTMGRGRGAGGRGYSALVAVWYNLVQLGTTGMVCGASGLLRGSSVCL